MTERRFNPYVLRDREGENGVADAVKRWWAALLGDEEHAEAPTSKKWNPSGKRALLRRCVTPDDALLTEGFRDLWFHLPETRRRRQDMQAWGMVATVLADVRHHEPDRTFAYAMASEPTPDSSTPRVSELRFQQLLWSRTLEDFTRRARRMVHLIDQRVDVRSLADDLLHWNREKFGFSSHRPDDRLAVRWANDYYTQLAIYEHKKPASTS